MTTTDLECILDRALTERILSMSVEVFPEDGILFRQGDSPVDLYFVKSGEVILSMPAEEAEVRVRAGKGSPLGLPAVIGKQPYSMTAKAPWDAEVFKLTSDAFHELLRIEPRMQQAILQILAAEVRAARSTLSKALSERVP